MVQERLNFPDGFLDAFCKRNSIRKLSLFGSILRSDFRTDSDVDMLVEFAQGKTPSLRGIARLEIELAKTVGRKVDLRTPEDIGRHMRSRVLSEAQLAYAYRG
jgi:predicted nucleotidyltransferase